MTPHRARALGRQRYPSGPRTRRIHAAVPATSGPPQVAPGGRAYQTHRTHGRKISCIRLYLSLGAVRGRAAPRCDPLRLSPRLGRICDSVTFVFSLSPASCCNTHEQTLSRFQLPPLDTATLAAGSPCEGCPVSGVVDRVAFFYVSRKKLTLRKFFRKKKSTAARASLRAGGRRATPQESPGCLYLGT